jgi:DAK2 domain fusion protein YloV
LSLAELSSVELCSVMEAFSSALDTHKAVLNRLNVYPVPDGDTGTNMQLTVASVATELAGLNDKGDLEAVCRAIAHGSLMGARGNSGVILCQVLRGLSECFSRAEAIDGPVLANALQSADKAARAGVMRPVEGTILTVGAEAARAAVEAAGDGLLSVAEAARRAAVEALADTPRLLPVLEKAGVVDAGGAGLVLLYDSLLHSIDGRPMPERLELPVEVAANLERAPVPLDALPSGEEEEETTGLRYEVMYFLEADDAAIPAFKQVWSGIGDSIVVVGGEGIWNCHIHTDDIGGSIEAALDVGRPSRIRVTDLAEQVEEESWVRQAAALSPEEELEAEEAPCTSVIAVATGEGIRRIFGSLGVRHIVAGGQSMNPSTAEILEMIESVPGQEVVLLPNNKNIHAVAAQAAEVASKPARVVATEGIQEGFAALLEYDPEAGASENAANMSAAACRVLAGEVTQAVRASESPAGRIEPGDWIGLSRKGIEVVATSAAEAVCGLLDKLVTERHEIVTLIEGAAARPAETRQITEWLAANRPGASVELHQGGQPLYPYLVSIE